MFSILRRAAIAGIVLALPLMTQARAEETVTVFAAASLKNALDDAGAAFTKQTGIAVKTSYAASSTLAKQLDQGAPADIFASADLQWMDHAEKGGTIRKDTRVNLLGNDLVVVAPADSKLTDLSFTPAAFAAAIGDSKWTTGTVATVPAGIYAKTALTHLGIYDAIESKLAQADNVRAALAFVSRGEAALGVVYKTDANADRGVKVVATFPADSHEPVIYPFALTSAAKGEAAQRYLDFLKSAEARPYFEKQGFVVLAK